MSILRVSRLLLALIAAQATAAAAADLRVEVVTAAERPVPTEVQLSGTLEAVDSVVLGFRQGGRVVTVLVEEGDEVRADQALARLDPVQQNEALKVAEASLSAAEAAQAQARQASDRAAAMLERGVGTRAARDAAAQQLSETEGAVERAQSAVEQARRAVEDMVLRAGGPGIVTGRHITPGQVIAAAQPALTLADTDGLEAVFRAADHPDLDKAMGRTLRLRTIDIDRPEMTGEVIEIAPLVDPQTGTVNLRARVDAVEGSTALLGAAVRGYLEMPGPRGVALPWTVLMREGDHPAVWIVGADDRVSLAAVSISHFTDGLVYLDEGVAPGTRVVGAGSQLLYPGRRIEPATVAPEAAR
ncbi:efflux RND transporter periplasmic adaptor subunit [Paracoccus spongiarum]|uniref:Efflux RND transporter periplasmic adaptor subunit n=1 Tax=Paracoccus spongiarum TaxID=3064387 RepID=A0ABT9JFH4_9RHOB|nr:efflux RND transporter periplasmic adaptor subunit [Paracoccus sp. 2205BS29-5]MDP5308546.1 efflux RND transporter periplasmic adaptor subunit [Paracoccus sp. 2205BS29-5]